MRGKRRRRKNAEVKQDAEPNSRMLVAWTVRATGNESDKMPDGA
jgi:hypothetical protein